MTVDIYLPLLPPVRDTRGDERPLVTLVALMELQFMTFGCEALHL
jgi:hypothetical protein